MGVSCSNIKVGGYDDNEELRKFLESFNIQSSDFSYYHKIFSDFEDDLGALSEIDYILNSMEEDNNRNYLLFERRLLSIFDEDSTGYINYADFIVSIWNFCSIDKEHISDFLFNIYDTNYNDILSKEEIIILIKEICGRDANKQLKKITTLTETDAYTIKEFKSLMREHSDIFAPIVKLQESIKQKTRGDSYWKTHCDNRRVRGLFDGKGEFCPLDEVIKMTVPPSFFVNATKRRFRRLQQVLQMTSSTPSTPNGSDKKLIITTTTKSNDSQSPLSIRRDSSPFNEAYRVRESRRLLETINKRQQQQQQPYEDTDEDFSGSSSHGNGYIRKHLHDNEAYGNKYQNKRQHCNHGTHPYDNNNNNNKDKLLFKTHYKTYKLSKETGLIYTN